MKKLNVVGKKGAYDDDGNLIIPFEYVEVCALNNGVYYARKTFQNSEYHLYTAKGKLAYPETITKVQWSNEKNLLAVYGKTETAAIVEVDYESNTINTIYTNSINSMSQLTDDLLLLTNIAGEAEIFSCDQKKVIATFKDSNQLVAVTNKGFVLESAAGKSFWDLSGNKVLDDFHDIKVYDDFIIGVDKARFWKLYSYEGKELNPYKYSGNEFTDGIIPRLTQINGEKVWLFITNDKIIDSEDLTKKLETADGACLIWTFEEGAPIVVYEDIGNVIVKEKNKQTLYKLVKDQEGNIVANVVFEADRIKRIPQSDFLFEVWKGRRRGVCNKNGLLGIPFKWQLFKTSYEKIGDIDH